jgi:hypothetical protein
MATTPWPRPISQQWKAGLRIFRFFLNRALMFCEETFQILNVISSRSMPQIINIFNSSPVRWLCPEKQSHWKCCCINIWRCCAKKHLTSGRTQAHPAEKHTNHMTDGSVELSPGWIMISIVLHSYLVHNSPRDWVLYIRGAVGFPLPHPFSRIGRPSNLLGKGGGQNAVVLLE